jgi:arsenate reductase
LLRSSNGETARLQFQLQLIHMKDHIRNVLFLCTGNSARSILAEALLNHEGGGRFRAYSAGSQPQAEPHPAALALLREQGYATGGFRSKSWDEFAGPEAPPMDLIITVCDSAAGETCPIWPGHPATAHWGLEDPAAVDGDKQDRAFFDAMTYLRRRISLLVELSDKELDELAWRDGVREIGRLDDGSRSGG